MRGIRRRLTYSNVMSTLAVVLVLGGGTAFAAYELGKNSVKSRNIAPGAVHASDIARKAVKRLKIAPAAVDGSRLAGAAVGTAKIAGGAVTAEKIADGDLDESKLAQSLKTKVNTVERGPLTRVDAFAGAQADAPQVALVSRGAFRIYGKCWVQASMTTGQAYVATTQPGALATGTLGNFLGQSTYLNPDSNESQRRFATGTANNLSTVPLAGSVNVIYGPVSIQFGVSGAIKGASVASDANNYGPGGSRCLFAPYLIQLTG